MKRLLLLLVTLLLFSVVVEMNGFAAPIPVQVGDAIQFADGPGDPATVPAGRGGAFLASSPSSEWDDFVTFCLEINEPLSFSGTFEVAGVSTGAIRGGVGGQDPAGGDFDPLDPFTAWLYTQAVSGAYADSLLDDVQYAIWFTENEISSLTGAALDFYDVQQAAYVASGWGDSLGNVRVLNIVSARGLCRQDVLVEAVPEPATMLLLGTGLIGLVGVGRMKLFKRG